MKKFLSLVLALVMTMSLVTISAGATDFTDDADITYDEAVSVISEIGVVNGYANGSFGPEGGLTRQAAAKIICNMILGPTTAAELDADTAPYPDVAVDSDFAGYIAYCQKEGIISGYADGTFKGSNPLTGYAFMKMLLGALGYDAATEGYTGANWSINVAKQAIGIGLNAGLMEDFNGSDYVTREEAALYAFNTLKATMVEYNEKTTVTVGGAEVVLAGTAQDLAWGTGLKADGKIEADGFVQFAEKFFTKLEKRETVDNFDRPAYTWIYNKDEIGTFVDWTKMVAEYTVAIDGKELADLLGKTVIANSDVEYYVDGVEVDNVIKASNMVKANTNDYATTGNGILTQVFVDTDEDVITIVSINTFAAKVTSDYNTKKETLTVDVQDGGAYTYVTEVLSSDDFAGLDAYEDGDVVLVTVAETNGTKMTVQSVVEPEALMGVDVTKFSEDSYLVTDGTQYDYAERGDIWNELGDYYGSKLDNTYNVYFDEYGYVIATEVATEDSKYLFLTGYDLGGSYLATKNAEGFAIFTDGTSANIDIDVADTNDNIDTSDDGTSDVANYDLIAGGENQYNRWFTYSVDKNNVYTLAPVTNYNFMYAKDYVDSTNTGEQKINVNNVRIVDTASKTGSTKISYGNDDSVFITVDTDAVSKKNGADFVGITEVTSTYTGVQDVDLKIFNTTDNKLDAGDIAGQKEPAVFALYNDDLYIIAAIVIGEDNTTTDSYAYAIKNAKNEYKDADGYYYWDFDAIVDGKIVTLTVKEKGTTVLRDTIANAIDLVDFSMFKLTYDKDGYVVEADLIDDVKAGNADKLYDADDFNAQTIVDGADFKVYDVWHKADADLYAIGRTLYVNNKADRDVGLTIAADAPVVVIEEYTTGLKIDEYDTIKQALEALDDASTFKGHIAAALNTNGTAKYLVLKSTEFVTEDVNGGASNGSSAVNSIVFEKGFVGLYDKNGVKVAEDVNIALYQLRDNGYVLVDTYTVTASTALDLNSVLVAGETYKVVCGDLAVTAKG